MARQGDIASQYSLGVHYDEIKEFEESVAWYTKAALLGYAPAQYNLAFNYRYGEGVTIDHMKSIGWYTEAAEQGYAHAQAELGLCYLKGSIVHQDIEKAIRWLTRAADQGLVGAQHNLGVHYFRTKDYKNAILWLKKVAPLGDAGAQTLLGQCYHHSSGSDKNIPKAIEWYTKAASQGQVHAQRQLGGIYLNGEGIEKNHENALELLTKASEQGDTTAQHNLGVMYYFGEGVYENIEQAVKWLKKVIEGEPSESEIYINAKKLLHDAAIRDVKGSEPVSHRTLSVFVSYSWDSDKHRERVRSFILHLRSKGLNVIYDDDMELGDRITKFMEDSVDKSDKILYICTPQYKEKADSRKGGVGYENSIITGELYASQNERKYIPILFSGDWDTSIPVWAKGKLGIDLRDASTYENELNKLVTRLKE